MVLSVGRNETIIGRKYGCIHKEIPKDVTKRKKRYYRRRKDNKISRGLLPMYYANAIVVASANLAEAIKNAKNSERGILQQMFPEQRQEQTNKIYQEIQKKDVKSEEIEDLTKMMKEMKIQLMKSFNGNSGYEKRDRGYNNNNRREITCYRCEKKGHYSSNCEEEGEMKCYNCGKNGHMAKACKTGETKRDTV